MVVCPPDRGKGGSPLGFTADLPVPAAITFNIRPEAGTNPVNSRDGGGDSCSRFADWASGIRVSLS